MTNAPTSRPKPAERPLRAARPLSETHGDASARLSIQANAALTHLFAVYLTQPRTVEIDRWGATDGQKLLLVRAERTGIPVNYSRPNEKPRLTVTTNDKGQMRVIPIAAEGFPTKPAAVLSVLSEGQLLATLASLFWLQLIFLDGAWQILDSGQVVSVGNAPV